MHTVRSHRIASHLQTLSNLVCKMHTAFGCRYTPTPCDQAGWPLTCTDLFPILIQTADHLQVHTLCGQAVQAMVTALLLLCKSYAAVAASAVLPLPPWHALSCLCSLFTACVQPGSNSVFVGQVGWWIGVGLSPVGWCRPGPSGLWASEQLGVCRPMGGVCALNGWACAGGGHEPRIDCCGRDEWKVLAEGVVLRS